MEIKVKVNKQIMCSSLTKPDKSLNARATMHRYYPELKDKLTPILERLDL